MRAIPRILLVLLAFEACLSASRSRSDLGDAGGLPDVAEVEDPGVAPDNPAPDDPGVPDPGTAASDAPVTCVEALACVEASGNFSPAYAAPCVEGADTATKLQLQAILDCAQQQCSSYSATQVLQFGACVFDRCRDLVEPCSRTGSKTCQQTLQCAQACGMQMKCALGCEDAATYEARVAFARVAACLEAKCPGALVDASAAMTCVTTGPCQSTLSSCP